MRIEFLFCDECNSAVVTHLDEIEALRSVFEHPMLIRELRQDTIDRTLDAERLAAANAPEWFFLFQDSRAAGAVSKVELRFEGHDLFGAGRYAQAALDTGFFRETQHRPLCIIGQRMRRANRHTGKAQRTAARIDLHRTKWRMRRQRD